MHPHESRTLAWPSTSRPALGLRVAKAMGSSRGTILNSFHDLESLYIDRWNREIPLKMCLASEPVVGVCDWLDSMLAVNRPVLYAAFGSQA
jgi:hypothetical protein